MVFYPLQAKSNNTYAKLNNRGTTDLPVSHSMLMTTVTMASDSNTLCWDALCLMAFDKKTFFHIFCQSNQNF